MAKYTKFGERLIELCFVENLTNEKFAEIIKVSDSTVSRWKKGKIGLKLSKAIAIAEYFNCSLEFLIGRSEKQLDFIPHPPLSFYERLRQIMKEQSKTRYQLEKDLKKSHNLFEQWKDGADPFLDNIIDLADYFKVTADFFIGREK